MNVLAKLQALAEKLNKLGRHHRLPLALGIATVAAIGLTIVSVGIYTVAGFYRYDLSRPGFEKERQEIAKPEAQKTYDTTSPVTQQALNDFLAEFDARDKSLKSYGDFHDDSLSDESLQIAAPRTSAPQ